jgi:kinesin family member 2/24
MRVSSAALLATSMRGQANIEPMQSGPVPIVANFLAPAESGAQLLRLPVPEFHARCMRTPGMTVERAKAFRAKLWQLHIDSQDATTPAASASGTAMPRKPDQIATMSSREMNPTMASLPFKQRIRPGMVVGVHAASSGASTKELHLRIVLAPVGEGSYLCALVESGPTKDAYELNLWRQVTVDVNDMEREVILEYDKASRYYHLGI